MSDIEPVRHEPKKLAGRQQRHVEIEIAGFERGIRAAVLHLERNGAPSGRPGPADRLQAAGAKSGKSTEAEVTAAQRPPSAAVPMPPLQRTPQAGAGTNRSTGPDRPLSAGA
jgi:hypothetical protein